MFEQVFAAVEHTGFPPLGELGADRRRGVEGRDPGAGRAHPLGERALRHELRLDQTSLDIFGQDQPLRGPRRSGEGADHLLDLSVLDHLAHIGRIGGQGGAAARRIRHAGQVFGALLGDRLIEVDRHSDDGKPAEPEGRTIRNVADRIIEAGTDLTPGAHAPTADFLFTGLIMRQASPGGNPLSVPDGTSSAGLRADRRSWLQPSTRRCR